MSKHLYKVGDEVTIINHFPTALINEELTSGIEPLFAEVFVPEMKNTLGCLGIIVGIDNHFGDTSSKEEYSYIVEFVGEDGKTFTWNYLPDWFVGAPERMQERVASAVAIARQFPFSGEKLTPDLKRKRYDSFYMDVAKRSAEMSYAMRKKVGCIIVKDGRIISMGWNGMPEGFDNVCEDAVSETMEVDDKQSTPEEIDALIADGWTVIDHETGLLQRTRLVTKPEVLHAELNAIRKCAASHESTQGATVYITLSPCIECAKLLIGIGLERIVYGESYRDTKGIDLLEKAGILVEQFNP